MARCRGAISVAAGVILVGVAVVGARPALAGFPIYTTPTLVEQRVIQTNPFNGPAQVAIGDAEDVAWDPVRDTIWLVDDTNRQIVEIDKDTGELRTVIGHDQLAAIPSFVPGGPLAGDVRIGDMEAMAYDSVTDRMFLFSGSCCKNVPHKGTAFELLRETPGGPFEPETYQPLENLAASDFSGAGFRLGTLWAGSLKKIYTYDYDTDILTFVKDLTTVSGEITGVKFSPDGTDLWLTNQSDDLYRMAMPGLTHVPNQNCYLTLAPDCYVWKSLKPFGGVRDGRAAEVIGDELFICDGYDGYSHSNPLRYAIHVYKVVDANGQPPPSTTTTTSTSSTTTTTSTTQPTSTASSTTTTTTTSTTTTSVPPPDPLPSNETFHGISPIRLMDTRSASTIDGRYLNAGRLQANATTALQVIGRGQVPVAGVGAVALNVTAIDPSGESYLTVWPTGTDRPTASSLNTAPGTTVANMVVVPVGANGTIQLFNESGNVDVAVDLLGWFPTSNGFTGVTPARLLDTRNAATVDDGFRGGGAVSGGSVKKVSVLGRGDVPASGVTSVSVNVTATGATTSSFVTVWPSDQDRPTASNLNVIPGVTAANMVNVPVAADGTISLYVESGSVDLVVDVLGWFAPTPGFHPLAGARLADTRDAPTVDGESRHTGRVGAGANMSVRVLGRGGVAPSGVSSVILNVTAVDASASTYLTVWPSGITPPTASTLNVRQGRSLPNLVIVPVGADGSVSILNAFGSVDLVVDILGWFSAP